MRPPLITGENSYLVPDHRHAYINFNEAPADHGGKLLNVPVFINGTTTSMRPPLITGENGWRRRSLASRSRRTSMRPPLITGENVRSGNTLPLNAVLQ